MIRPIYSNLDPTEKAKIVAKICKRLADNGETLRQALAHDGMPSRSIFYEWLAADSTLADAYARAREQLVEYWADELIELSDEGTNDYMTRKLSSGGGRSDIDGKIEQETVPNHEHIQRSKLRADSRKWLMSKLLPRRYGETLKVDQRTEHSVTGSAAELIDAICGSGKRIHDKPEE